MLTRLQAPGLVCRHTAQGNTAARRLAALNQLKTTNDKFDGRRPLRFSINLTLLTKFMLNQIQFIRQIPVVLLTFSLLAGMHSGFAPVTVAQELKVRKTKNKPDQWDRQPQLTNAVVRAEERVYKSTPQGDLKLHIWSPESDGEDRPCIVFFFGGGWQSGTYRQFARQSAYLASRGMVAASAEYRIRKLHNTTPDVCVEDAKSAPGGPKSALTHPR